MPGLLVFPLVGVALAGWCAGAGTPCRWVVRVTAYVYATFYTALDVINGIAAGYVTHELGPGVPRPDEVRLLFRIGTPLGDVGSWALIAAAVLVAGDQLARRRRRSALLGAAAACPVRWLVHLDHIFSPRGVAGMVLIGLGTGRWALAGGPPDRRRRALNGNPGVGATCGSCERHSG